MVLKGLAFFFVLVIMFASIPTELEDHFSVNKYEFRQSIYTKKQPYNLYPPDRMTLIEIQRQVLKGMGTSQYVESYLGEDNVKFFCDFEKYLPIDTTPEQLQTIRETEFFPPLVSAFSNLVENFSEDQISWADSSGPVMHKGERCMKVCSYYIHTEIQ